jgi:hypothetical protein
MLSKPGYMQFAKARSLHMSPEMLAAFQPNSTTSRDVFNFTTQSQLPLPSEAFKRSVREVVEFLTTYPHVVNHAKCLVLGLTPLTPLFTVTEGFHYPPSHPHLRVPNITLVHQYNDSNGAELQNQNHTPLPSFDPPGTSIHKRCHCTMHVDTNPGQSSSSNPHELRNPHYMAIGNAEEAMMVASYPNLSGTPRELQQGLRCYSVGSSKNHRSWQDCFPFFTTLYVATNAGQSSRFNPHELRSPHDIGIGNVEEPTMDASYRSGSGAPRELQQCWWCYSLRSFNNIRFDNFPLLGFPTLDHDWFFNRLSVEQVRRSQKKSRSTSRDLSGKWYY